MLSRSLAAMLAVLTVWSAASADITLVEKGQPKATIVVAKEALGAEPEPTEAKIWETQPAPNKIAAAARDLQQYVKKITGAELPIVADDAAPTSGVVILVGKSAITTQRKLDARIPAGLTPQRDEEGFVIDGDDNWLLLAGNDEGPYHGTEYAVAEFLHRQGVRWYMPTEFGEVVPRKDTIRASEKEFRGKPDFKMRNWWGPQTAENRALEYRWKIRNGMNPVLHFLLLPSDSSVRAFIPTKEELEKNPELAELLAKTQDGKPHEGMPNLSNPKAIDHAMEKARAYIKQNPQYQAIGIGADDGMPRDWTPETLKLNQGFPDVGGRVGVPAEQSITEEWMAYINGIAKKMQQEFPGYLVTTNGYANRNTPPQGMTLEPNVAIMFAAIWSDTLHAYDNPRSWQAMRQGRMIKRWAELSKNVYMYNYTYYMLASGGTPIPLSRKHAHDMPLYKKWGVIGFSDEGRTVLMEQGVFPYYLRARMMWDADLDVAKEADAFFADWYGPAAKPARAFWDALEEAIETSPILGHEDRVLPYLYTPELMATLERHVAEAERLATDERSKPRVRADRLILDHLEAYQAMHAAEWNADFAECVKQADAMLAARQALSEISPFYTQPSDETTTSGFYYWGVFYRKKYYQEMADLTTGKTGELIVKLPDTASFRTDPRDDGRFSDWYAPQFDDKGWETLKTTEPFLFQGHMDEQGYPYMGPVWYRFDVDVPEFQESREGRTVKLYTPVAESEAWVWVNGQYIGHRPYREAYERPNPIDMDVTKALQPGKKNQVTIRIHTNLNPAAQAGGLYSRVFLYSPKQASN